MQVPTSATGYEEEAQAAATGHEEAQATAIDQEKKPSATGAGVVSPPRDRSRSPRGAPDPPHRQIAEIMIIIIIIIIIVVCSYLGGSVSAADPCVDNLRFRVPAEESEEAVALAVAGCVSTREAGAIARRTIAENSPCFCMSRSVRTMWDWACSFATRLSVLVTSVPRCCWPCCRWRSSGARDCRYPGPRNDLLFCNY